VATLTFTQIHNLNQRNSHQ